jgi:hypothetical protein
MINNKTLQDIILAASEKLNIPDDVIEIAYREYWNWVKDTLENVPVNEDMTEEEFTKMQTSINVPSLGKFYASYSRAQFLNKKFKEYAEKAVQDKEGDASVHEDDSNI